MGRCFFVLSMMASCCAGTTPAQETPRLMLTGAGSVPDEAFLQFIERVKPDIVIVGAFGPPQFAGQADVPGWLGKWRTVFERLARHNVKVVGTIELLNVGNSPKEAQVFIDFYEKRWDEKLFGKRPAVAARSLLEQREMPEEKQTGAYAPRGCANNPHWREVEKGLIRPLIEAGIGGFITHRNMFEECGCPHCLGEKNAEPRGFRRWLTDRYSAAELRERFGVAEVKTHSFRAIRGHHREHEKLPDPLTMEGMKFARHAVRDAFEEVFIQYGQKLKPGLLAAQWNHMPYFDELHSDKGHLPPFHLTTFAHASGNERWSLPPTLWGRGEDFFWYCNWGTAQNTQLARNFVGDVTLHAKLLRTQAGGRPYVVNKYDYYRPRAMLAEAFALGMMPGAITVPYRPAEDADVMARWYAFFRTHARLFANNNGASAADVLLIYPRSRTHVGEAGGLEMVEAAGRTMIVEHMQFDMAPDDLLAKIDLAKYRAVIAVETQGLDREQFGKFIEQGGKVILLPRSEDLAGWHKEAVVIRGIEPHSGGSERAEPLRRAIAHVLGERRAEFRAPYTVEAHVYRQPGRMLVHLVNYNHKEKAAGKSAVEREAPITAAPVEVRLPVPTGSKVKGVTFLDPDAAEQRRLEVSEAKGMVRFTTPEFLVYGLAVVEVE